MPISSADSVNRDVTGKLRPESTTAYNIVGKPVRRVDVPFKVTGAHTYMQTFAYPMLHGRPIRPPAFGAKLIALDESSVKDVPGLVKVVVKETSWASCASAKSKRSAPRAI